MSSSVFSYGSRWGGNFLCFTWFDLLLGMFPNFRVFHICWKTLTPKVVPLKKRLYWPLVGQIEKFIENVFYCQTNWLFVAEYEKILLIFYSWNFLIHNSVFLTFLSSGTKEIQDQSSPIFFSFYVFTKFISGVTNADFQVV